MESPNLLVFKECCFFETNNVDLSYANFTFETESCYSDINDENFTFVSSITTHYFKIDPLCDLLSKNTCENNNYYELHSLLTLIVILL